MGNQAIATQDLTARPQPQEAANGYLAWIGAEFIGRGSEQLPPAGPDQADNPIRTVTVTGVPRFGAVRLTFELWSYRHGKSRHWSWRAVRADPLMLALKVRPVRWLDDFYWQAGR